MSTGPLETPNPSGGTLLEERTVSTDDGDHEKFAHYVEKSKIVESAVTGTPVKALCGKVWIPNRDPSRFPDLPRVPGDPQVAVRRRLLTLDSPSAANATLWDERHRPLTIGIVAIMTLMAFEGIATATAMPVVARELGITGDYTWAFTAFVVASLFSMVAGGVWSDTSGPRGPLLAGVSSVLVGSIVAGAANGLMLLIAGRSLQGLGVGAVIVSLYVLIARAYDVALRPKAFSVLAAAWVVPSLVGPLVAGFLADHVSWRWVFWLVPVIVIPATAIIVPRIANYQGGQPQPSARKRLLAGLVATLALFAVQDGALRPTFVGVVEVGIGIAVLLASIRHVLPPGALRMRRGLPTSTMMRGFLAAAYFSAEVFVPLALVETRGLSVTAAGLTLALSAVMWSIGSYVQSRLPGDQDRSVAVRVGAAIVTVGIVTLPLALIPAVPPWIAAISWAIGALGMGLAIPSIAVQVMRLSPPEDQGVNSAAIQIVDSVGVVIATAALGFGYATATRADNVGSLTFTVLWLGSAAIAAMAAVLAGRMRVARPVVATA